jgi:hypothetical protein
MHVIRNEGLLHILIVGPSLLSLSITIPLRLAALLLMIHISRQHGEKAHFFDGNAIGEADVGRHRASRQAYPTFRWHGSLSGDHNVVNYYLPS